MHGVDVDQCACDCGIKPGNPVKTHLLINGRIRKGLAEMMNLQFRVFNRRRRHLETPRVAVWPVGEAARGRRSDIWPYGRLVFAFSVQRLSKASKILNVGLVR